MNTVQLEDPEFAEEDLRIAVHGATQMQQRLRGDASHAELELLRFAAMRSAFYSAYFPSVSRVWTPRHLERLPLLDRSALADAEKLRASGPGMDDAWVLGIRSSSSTGRPVTVYSDLGGFYSGGYAVYDAFMELRPDIRALLAAGKTGAVFLNDRPGGAHRSYMLPGCRGSILRSIPFRHERSREQDRDVVRWMRGQKIPLLVGKPWYLMRLMAIDQTLGPLPGSYREGACRGIRPAAILCVGSELFLDYRERLEAWFRCTVTSAYMSVEGGLIAIECPEKNGFHVSPTVRAWVAPGSEAPTSQDLEEEGEGELVISNLANWAMPILRYRTGDWGEIRNIDCPCGFSGQSVVRLTGRALRYFRVGDRLVSTESLARAMRTLPLLDYQVVQYEDESFDARFVPDGPVSDGLVSGIGEQLGSVLRSQLGAARVRCIELDEIPSVAGKLRRFMSAQDPGFLKIQGF